MMKMVKMVKMVLMILMVLESLFFFFEPAVMTVWAISTPSLYGLWARMATHVPGVPGTGKTRTHTHTYVLLITE